jgi:rubrerythrin
MRIAEMFDNQEGKQIFIDLSQEEKNHQRILEDEFYHLSNKGTIIWE